MGNYETGEASKAISNACAAICAYIDHRVNIFKAKNRVLRMANDGGTAVNFNFLVAYDEAESILCPKSVGGIVHWPQRL